MKLLLKRIFLFVLAIILSGICGALLWYSSNQEKYIRELSLALQKEQMEQAKEIVDTLKASKVDFINRSPEIKKLIAQYEGIIKNHATFTEVSAETDRILNMDAHITRMAEVEKQLAKCKEQATYTNAVHKYNAQWKLFSDKYGQRILDLQYSHCKEIYAQIKALHEDFKNNVIAEKYTEAMACYEKAFKLIKEVSAIKYFEDIVISRQKYALLQEQNWVVEAHKIIHDKMVQALEAEQFDAAKRHLKQYIASETLLKAKNAETLANDSGFPSASKMNTKIMEAANKAELVEGIVRLQELAGEIQRILDVDNIGPASDIDDRISAYTELHTRISQIAHIIPEQQKEFKETISPSTFTNILAEKRLYTALYSLIAKYVNQGQSLAQALHSAMQDSSVNRQQKQIINNLLSQNETLNEVLAYKKNPNTVIADDSTNGFFIDLKNFRSFTEEYAKTFPVMKEELVKAIRKMQGDAQFYFSFKDSRGTPHEWRGKISDLRAALKKTRGNLGKVVRFTLGADTIQIEGTTVRIINAKDSTAVPVVCRNSTFVYPENPTRDALWDAYDGDSMEINKFAADVEALMPKSPFDPNYSALLKKLQEYKQIHIQKRFELCMIMLKPFYHTYTLGKNTRPDERSPFFNAALSQPMTAVVKVYTEMAKAMEEMNSTTDAYTQDRKNNYFSNILENANFDVLENYSSAALELQEMRKMVLDSNYAIIGFAKLDGRIISYTLLDGIEQPQGDIWYFDTDGQVKFAGKSDGRNIVWSRSANFRRNISIFFVPLQIQESALEAQKYISKLRGAKINQVTLPLFFPQDLRK